MNMDWMIWITEFFLPSLKNSKAALLVLPLLLQLLVKKPGTLEEVYEPFLIQEGFLQRTPRGREATAKAYEHLGRIDPGTDMAGTLFS